MECQRKWAKLARIQIGLEADQKTMSRSTKHVTVKKMIQTNHEKSHRRWLFDSNDVLKNIMEMLRHTIITIVAAGLVAIIVAAPERSRYLEFGNLVTSYGSDPSEGLAPPNVIMAGKRCL